MKYVHRDKKEQLSRNEETNLKNDGYQYITIYNNGTGESERYSLSWDAKFGDHSIWANASYSQNSESNSDYTATPDNTPIESLVYYEGELMSLSELDTLKANFGRPVTANFGWNTDWTNTFSTGLTATYSGSYTTAIKSSSDQRIGIGSECTTCEAVEIFVPKYEAHTFDSRIMFALSSRWDYQISQSQSLEVRLDISNLFNARSHAITEGNSGIEPGRMFWLGVSYNYE